MAWRKVCSLESVLHALGCIRQFGWQQTRVGMWKNLIARVSLRTSDFTLKAMGSHSMDLTRGGTHVSIEGELEKAGGAASSLGSGLSSNAWALQNVW